MAADFSDNFPFSLEPSPLLRRREVLELLRISNSCLYTGIAKGIYPKPIRISSRTVAWRREDIERIMRDGVQKAGEKAYEK